MKYLNLILISLLLTFQSCQRKKNEKNELQEIVNDTINVASDVLEITSDSLSVEEEGVYGFIPESAEEAEKYKEEDENKQWEIAVRDYWIEKPEYYLTSLVLQLKELKIKNILNPSGFIDLEENYYIEQKNEDIFIGNTENDFLGRYDIQLITSSAEGIINKELKFNNFPFRASDAQQYPEGIYVNPNRVYPISFDNLTEDQNYQLLEINKTLTLIPENDGFRFLIVWENENGKFFLEFLTYLQNGELKIYQF